MSTTETFYNLPPHRVAVVLIDLQNDFCSPEVSGEGPATNTHNARAAHRADGLCAAGSWGAELFVDPVPGSEVVVKHRFDTWQSPAFLAFLEDADIDGL